MISPAFAWGWRYPFYVVEGKDYTAISKVSLRNFALCLP
jgi:hypothetical protein